MAAQRKYVAAGRLISIPRHGGPSPTSVRGRRALAPSDDDNRRVLAVLAYLDS